MASFNCILHLDGRYYPVTKCSYEFEQTVNERGRAMGKVRTSLIHLTLPVPDDDVLLAWAADAHKKMSGQLTFDHVDQPFTHEELSFEDGFCVAYEEVFAPGTTREITSYVCTLQISAARLSMGATAKDSYWAKSR